MQKFYITTSIPYVNSVPHLGNVLDSVYADVLARYKRERGFDVRFLTGSDEHGVKIVRSAAATGLTPNEFVDKNSAQFKALKEALNLSWDDFIRTSDRKRHWPGAQKIWKKLEEAGDLYKKIYRGLYCVGHEAFVTEKDLGPVRSRPAGAAVATATTGRPASNGMEAWVCNDHQTVPEIVEEENWFFKLSKYSKEIEKRIITKKFVITPESREHEILSLLKTGLEDVSFSRPSKDLSWGVPVPGDDTQTIYVWAEALVSYISALGYGSDNEADFEKFWLNTDEITQVIGKDNLRFHAAIWPGILLASGLPLPKTLFVHGFLTVDGKKISKTVGNVIDPFELIKKYGTDAVRYYLLKEISPFEDGDFSYEKFETLYNSDLANGIGNFTARVLALGEKVGELKGTASKEIIAKIEEIKKIFETKLLEFKFHEAAAAIWELVHFGDVYVNNEKPWEGSKPEVILNATIILEELANLLLPFLPSTAGKISASISHGKDSISVKKGEALFPRL